MSTPLDNLNTFIRAEHGNRVTLEDKLIDSGLDSFGLVMVLADMDGEYGCYGKSWFQEVNIPELTVKDLLDRIPNENTKL